MASRWELLVSQGKYSNEILKNFCMESSKPMDTHLVGIWRNEHATLGEEVEVTINRHLVGSLMYLVSR